MEMLCYRRRLVTETFCSRDVVLQETLCYRRRCVTGDVVLRRRFVPETFCYGDVCAEKFCRRVVSCGDVMYVRLNNRYGTMQPAAVIHISYRRKIKGL
jgi:hypothetical protein